MPVINQKWEKVYVTELFIGDVIKPTKKMIDTMTKMENLKDYIKELSKPSVIMLKQQQDNLIHIWLSVANKDRDLIAFEFDANNATKPGAFRSFMRKKR